VISVADFTGWVWMSDYVGGSDVVAGTISISQALATSDDHQRKRWSG
jgi:hypothetical protein